MARWETLNPDSNAWDRIALQLRRLRELNSCTMDDSAAICGVHQSTYARYESGETPLPVERAIALDKAWRLQRLFETLVRVARQTGELNWWDTYKEIESKATAIKIYEPLVVPGLLQTEPYMRAQFLMGQRDDIEDAVVERLRRQEVLTNRATSVFAILDPACIYRRYGSLELMRVQLQHLLDLMERPNIAIRVVYTELRGYGGLSSGFTLVYSPSGDIAQGTIGLTGRHSQDPTDIQRAGLTWDRIGNIALSTEQTRDLLQRIVRGQVDQET